MLAPPVKKFRPFCRRRCFAAGRLRQAATARRRTAAQPTPTPTPVAAVDEGIDATAERMKRKTGEAAAAINDYL